MILIVLSLVNYTATHLRGENRRVTGYIPLWLIAFGNGLGTIVLGCAGVVEIYLRELLAIDHDTVIYLLTPLLIMRLVCLMAIAIGVMVYALGFWARYPKIISSHV